jgi:hypothetical protein
VVGGNRPCPPFSPGWGLKPGLKVQLMRGKAEIVSVFHFKYEFVILN